jgi:protein-S-isoprenylcysteine O-methyltransferase Ste14
MPENPPINVRGIKIVSKILMIALFSSFIYSIFVPIKLGTIWFYIGLPIYIFAIFLITISTINFTTTPINKPVTKGIYRYSRNPMFIGFFLCHLGIAIACISWVYLLLTIFFIITTFYLSPFEENITLKYYGKPYKEYMKRTPKWIGIPKRDNNIMKKNYSCLYVIPSTIMSILLVSQIIGGIYLLSNITQNKVFAYFGIGLYIFSGLIFGMLPVFEFRKKGNVKKGKSYIHTTKLVDTGIYSIVRHPQYTTFILFAIAGMLLFQHWIVIILGILIIPLTYIDLLNADKDGIMKFGVEYKQYMKKVPRTNFFLGIIRILRQKQ